MPDLARATELARNTVLLGRTAVHHALDDPLLLVVQTVRRLPRSLRGPIARTLALGGESSPTLRSAFAHFVSDRPDAAAAALASAPQPRTSTGRRLAAELAVQLGEPDAAPGGVAAAPAVTRARAAWQRGDVSQAIHHASSDPVGQRYRARLQSERRTMTPGFRLIPPSVPPARASSPDGDVRALHILTNSLPRTRSGYAIRSHAVLRAQLEAGVPVEAVTRIGYPVTVGLPHAWSTDVVEGVTYRRLLPTDLARTPAERLQQMVDHVLGLIDRFGPTVLHTTTNYTNALVTEAAARAAGLPWVYEVRGQLEKTWLASRPAGERAAAERSERYTMLRQKETEMALAADHVVTLSETLRDDLVSRGVAASGVTVVPNGVDETLIDLNLDPEGARAELGLPAEGFWIGTVSSLVGYEGLETLVSAVAALRDRGLDVRGALVGDGVSRPSLIGQAAQLGIADAVVFPGRVDRTTAALWHRALDTFVVPRHDLPVCRVVTPLKPIEAMAAGRPVVASDLPALAEIVREPATGIVVPPGDVTALADAVAALAADPSRRSGYGEAGRAFARTRTWRANGQVYRGIYERVLGAS